MEGQQEAPSDGGGDLRQIREAQRQKWLQAQQEKQEKEQASASATSSAATPPASSAAASSATVASAPAAASAPAGSAASSSAASAGYADASTASTAPRNCRRCHILPVGALPGGGDQRRLEMIAESLRKKRRDKDLMRSGLAVAGEGGHPFVVVKADPEESLLSQETDYFVEGDPVVKFSKVQFICLWDFESQNVNQDAHMLFSEYISPYFKSMADAGEDISTVCTVGDTMKIFDLEFQVMAAEPSPPDIGLVDTSTMIYVDWDSTPEFDKIHIVPFQDTLPHAYEFDVFSDYLKPYLTKYKHNKFGVNDQFTFQGVQFKVVCCEPNGPARIGRNTTIYCEGVLHPSLRNLLPPELLEQLSHLPPGLQMLLLNTEALAGGYEERLIEVQEMLSRRRGLSNDTIDRVDKFRWEETGRENAQTQCMVCLSNFTSGEEVRRLPCGHVFHTSCIDEWLRRCTDCPICKANVDRAVRQY